MNSAVYTYDEQSLDTVWQAVRAAICDDIEQLSATEWVVTTTLLYDNNGNLISSGNGSATTTYTYDYANRLIALFAGGATTTYGYDAFGARVLQTGTTTTYIYPSKFYSIASSTGSGAKFATTTEYVFNGDTLLSTVDQQTASGIATGTPQTRYIHPDHLGSTNVVTDQNGALVQTLDYYPYGATRVSVSTSTNERRQYIGQFTDNSNLSYLNARYYNGTQGQFISEDPVFWEIGLTNDGKQAITNPQALNSYAYANDNPVTGKDPQGRCPWCLPFLIGGAAGGISQYAGDVMANRAAGITGAAAYAPRSSWQEYNAAVATGAVTGAVATAGIIYGGIAAAFGSAGQDWVGGRDVNVGKAVATGVGTAVTGGFFKWGAGASPAEIYMQSTGRSFSTLPYAIFRNEVRFTTSNEVFGSGVNTIIQSRYQTVQSYNTSSGASSPQSQLWVTPSGAVVNWGGGIVAGPAAQSTPATIKK